VAHGERLAHLRSRPYRGARKWLRAAITVISASAIALSIGAAVAVWIVDSEAFTSFDEALWWAIVTVGTVGYGDVVPNNDAGRFVAAVLILFSMAFFPVLTGLVTAALLERRDRKDKADAKNRHTAVLEALRSIDARLDQLEDRNR
jgi:voltage-gated potassium channel Kch